MKKIKIDVEIPDYSIKYCYDVWHGGNDCKFLMNYNNDRYYCLLSNKEITKVKNKNKSYEVYKVCRPYGCRCLVKSSESK